MKNTVTKSDLEKRLETIDQRFMKVKAEQDGHQKIVDELQTELVKLQGEYRAVQEFIAEMTPDEGLDQEAADRAKGIVEPSEIPKK